MGGRFMLNGVMVANEVTDEVKKDKHKECLVFKVDFKKAYDSISWEFLFFMMRKMDFVNYG